MSLKGAYAVGFLLSMTSAMLCVLLGGQLPLVAWLALLSPFAFLRFVLGPAMPRATLRKLGTLVGIVSVLYGVSVVALEGLESLVVGAATALLGILSGRILSRENLGHDLQALLLSLMLVYAGAVLHMQMTYGLIFALYAVSATWALVVRQLWAGAIVESERQDGVPVQVTLLRRDVVTPRFLMVTSSVALFTLVLTSGLFVLFPRVGLGGLSFLRGARNRLPEAVRLDQAPRGLNASDEVVARVVGIPYGAFARGLYLRAAVFESLDKRGFAEASRASISREEVASAKGDVTYEVFLAPLLDARLPVLGPYDSADLLSGGTVAGIQALQLLTDGARARLTVTQFPDGPLRYRVKGRLGLWADEVKISEQESDPVEHPELVRALALPEELDPRIAALAQDLTKKATSREARAHALRTYLLSRFEYTLTAPSSTADAPLSAFLFDDQRGHCEFFAAAYATLLRTLGVPARVVGGFAGGIWDDEGGVIVFTAEHAHAWVEWYAPGVGWVTDDATPVSDAPRERLDGISAFWERTRRLWDTYVLDYGLDEQLTLARRAWGAVGQVSAPKISGTQSVLVAVLLLATAILGWALWRKRTARRGAAEELGLLIAAACGRLNGAEVDPSQTLRGAVVAVTRTKPARVGTTLQVTLKRYEAARFGGASLTYDDVRQCKKELAALVE